MCGEHRGAGAVRGRGGVVLSIRRAFAEPLPAGVVVRGWECDDRAVQLRAGGLLPRIEHHGSGRRLPAGVLLRRRRERQGRLQRSRGALLCRGWVVTQRQRLPTGLLLHWRHRECAVLHLRGGQRVRREQHLGGGCNVRPGRRVRGRERDARAVRR